MNTVLLLNADYSPLGVVPFKRAMKLLAKKRVEIVKYTETIIHNWENTLSYMVPSVIKLIKYIRALWRSKVPFNKRNLLFRDGFHCVYCNADLKKTPSSIDHIVPTSRGGKTSYENCVAACVKCNNKKDNKTPNEAKMTLRHMPYTPTINEFVKIQIKGAGLDTTLRELGII